MESHDDETFFLFTPTATYRLFQWIAFQNVWRLFHPNPGPNELPNQIMLKTNDGYTVGYAHATTYDTGSVWITVNGVQTSVSYGQSSTTATLASALVSAVNANTSLPVTASLSGSMVNLTAKTTGAGTNYALASGSSMRRQLK